MLPTILWSQSIFNMVLDKNINPDAEKFLKLIRKSRNGKFKIYIGLAAGVGNHIGCCLSSGAIKNKIDVHEYIQKIFQKFVQVNRSNIESQYKGVGLGLAIAKEFIEAHKGTIWINSE